MWLSWNSRKLLEGLILGNFVVRQVRNLLNLAGSLAPGALLRFCVSRGGP
jgi:hypothetical protein